MNTDDVVYLINQVFTMHKKIASRDLTFLDRNFSRIENKFNELGYTIVNPFGEIYTDTRTDLSAHIASNNVNSLRIIEVLKPIIYYKTGSSVRVIQVGNVIVG